MHSSNPVIVAAGGGGYVPYFYEAGLHILYQLPFLNVSEQQEDAPRSSYGFAVTGAALRAVDRPQTVEDVIAAGYFAVPQGDPVTAIISDKQHTSRLGLDDVIGQVRQRYEIYEQNLQEIEFGKCAAMNTIYFHEAYHGPGSANDRQHYARHKRIQDLYEQEREERTTLWKDISRLRTQLPESAQQYLTAHRKMTVLS